MFGRGVIATIYGQAFEQAGHEVEFYVRPGRAAQYGGELQTEIVDARRSPLGKLTRTTMRPRMRESIDPADTFDLVVLSVGHHRLREAAEYLEPRVGRATVLVFGNVWDEPLSAIAPLRDDQVVFGFPRAGGGFDADGILHGAMFRAVTVGMASRSPSHRELAVQNAFQQAGFTIKTEADMRGWLWLHFISDAGMFSQALRSGGLANVLGDRRALRDAFLGSRELLPLLERRGVDLRRHRRSALSYRLPRLAAVIAARATALFPVARASMAAHTDPNTGEARAVLDDTITTAHQLGVATPRLLSAG